MPNPLTARSLLLAFVFMTSAVAFSIAGCSSGGGTGLVSRIVGQALAPETVDDTKNAVPLADADVVLLTYDEEGNLQTAHVGTTDSNGNFDVSVEAQAVIAIVVDGATNDGDVAVSGLYNPDQEMLEKDLDPATSVACTAGIAAIEDDSIAVEELDETRVQNLEDASVDYIEANPDFDFYDSAEVDAAVAAVRAATNDGANPAAPGAFS